MVRAEGPAAAGGQPPFAVHALGQFEGLPALGGQPGGERLLVQLAGRRDEGAERTAVVVPAGAGAGRPADQPGLAAARALQPHPGTALGVERERGDEFGVGGGPADEVEQIGLRWAARRGRGRGARGGRGEVTTDTGTVLGDREGSARRRSARAEEESGSTGRTTHAARVAEEVQMDPPPEARQPVSVTLRSEP